MIFKDFNLGYIQERETLEPLSLVCSCTQYICITIVSETDDLYVPLYKPLANVVGVNLHIWIISGMGATVQEKFKFITTQKSIQVWRNNCLNY